MSVFTLTPIWLIQNQAMGSSFVTQAVKLQYEDNIAIQGAWTGTPTGTLDLQVNLDPNEFAWQSVPITPTPTQPTGAPGTTWYEVNQSPAAWVRLSYTAVSGAGVFKAKIALKSV